MSYHIINDDPQFQHIDIVSTEEYGLLNAITSIESFLDASGNPESPEFSALLVTLESQMVSEAGLMDRYSLILQARNSLFNINSNTYLVAHPDLRLVNLYKLFNSIRLINLMVYEARRVDTVVNSDYEVIYPNSLVGYKDINVQLDDLKYNNTYNFTNLKMFNLKAGTEVIEFNQVKTYIKELSSLVPLENLYKNILFNNSSFTDSELYINQIMPNYLTVETYTETFVEFQQSSKYFNVTEVGYQTFNNYIDFTEISSVIQDILNSLKYTIDLIETTPISDSANTFAFYPTSKSQIYPMVDSLRRSCINLNIHFNIAYMFWSVPNSLNGLNSIESSLDYLINNQLSESELIALIMAHCDVTYVEAMAILYEGAGTPEQYKCLEDILSGYITGYNNANNSLSGINDIYKQVETSSGLYNDLVKNSPESGLTWDQASLEALFSMLLAKLGTLQSKLDILKAIGLGIFSFIIGLTGMIAYIITNALASAVQLLNTLITAALCALKALICMASYIISAFDYLISAVSSVSEFDPAQFLIDNLSIGADLQTLLDGAADLLSKKDAVLAEIDAFFTPSEKSMIDSILESTTEVIESSGIKDHFITMYTDVMEATKNALTPSPNCKFNPNIPDFGLNLDLNLKLGGLEIPDLSFRAGDCKGT